MNRSTEIGELTKALAKAQLEMQNPAFDSMNPHFKNKFASLVAVRNSVIPALAKHGITMTQEISTGDKGPRVLTVLAHESGQWQEYGPLEIPVSKGDAQGVGSAVTYGRRYHMMAVAGVVGDEDDDANAASKKTPISNQLPARAGAMGLLSQSEQKRVIDMAIEAIDAWNVDDIDTAFKLHVKNNKSLESADEKTALWDQYSSELRTALTARLEVVKALQKKVKEEMVGSQA